MSEIKWTKRWAKGLSGPKLGQRINEYLRNQVIIIMEMVNVVLLYSSGDEKSLEVRKR